LQIAGRNFGALNRNVRSIPVLRFLRHQAGDPLPSSQLAVKKHPKLRKRISKLAWLQEVLRIPRPALEFKLRLRECLEQQDAARPKRAL
jgi:hypothetical protein